MPHLLIRYRDLTLFDGDVDELSMADNANGISVAAKIHPARTNAGLLELLGGEARRRPTPDAAPAQEESA
jgi:hypothetical protein